MDAQALSNCLSYFRDVVTTRQGERELLDFEGPVVGTCCNFVPEELVWAVGGRTIRLCGGNAQWEAAGERREVAVPARWGAILKQSEVYKEKQGREAAAAAETEAKKRKKVEKEG